MVDAWHGKMWKGERVERGHSWKAVSGWDAGGWVQKARRVCRPPVGTSGTAQDAL